MAQVIFTEGTDSDSLKGAERGNHYGNQDVPGLPPFHKDPWDGPPNGHSRADPPFGPHDGPASVPEPDTLALMSLGLLVTVICLSFFRGRVNKRERKKINHG